MTINRLVLVIILGVLAVPVSAFDQERPRLLMSAADVALIKSTDPLPPSWSTAVAEARGRVDPFLEELPDIPVPLDAGGGYSHEQHKRNQATILEAGILYQLTGNKAYAELARDMLLVYAKMYPGLGEHPMKKEQSPGRLFWQSLNESVWLLTSIQGYDAIYESLTTSERETIETGLFRPLASFLSVEAPQQFDKIHNHGTWATAAVGMTGYVLDDPDYVDKALYGLKKDGSAGFLKQLDQLFSPDGYYAEGPYYQRYALMPFTIFAQAIQQNDPQLKIFEYRDGILLKAVDTNIQSTYGGYFFPVNDAIKDKGLDTIELYYAVSMAYGLTGDPGLLSIAELQDTIVLTGSGFRTAAAMDAGKAQPFSFRSMQFRDGPGGDQGALGILRSSDGPGHQALVLKATVQGMKHGHFDKLAWLFYDNGREIVSDYGAARFLNVEAKFGGHYLPENESWAKQTIAHNTLVVDESSHFGGDWEKGELQHPDLLYFGLDENADAVAARMDGAYEGVAFKRALVLLKNGQFPVPVVLDVLRAESAETHQYDLPLHFQGHITAVSHELDASTRTLSTLGEENGYQHLWLRAQSRVMNEELFQLTWLNANRFYTYSVLAGDDLDVVFTELGANDPDFNLRREQGVVLRAPDSTSHTFVSVLEPHGEYNGSKEFTTASASHIQAIQRVSEAGKDIIRIVSKNGQYTTIAISWNPEPGNEHSVEFDGSVIHWAGFIHVFDGQENHK